MKDDNNIISPKNYIIENSHALDLEDIYILFDEVIRSQQQKGLPAWKSFDKNVLAADVEDRNHYKIAIGQSLAIVFSVRYSDAAIWRQKEKGDAIYLHRIVSNPRFKGQQLFSLVLEWTIEHAKQKGLRFVRMDTWANNNGLIDYYKKFGFDVVENFTTPNSPDLPSHNRNLSLVLLEMEL